MDVIEGVGDAFFFVVDGDDEGEGDGGGEGYLEGGGGVMDGVRGWRRRRHASTSISARLSYHFHCLRLWGGVIGGSLIGLGAISAEDFRNIKDDLQW